FLEKIVNLQASENAKRSGFFLNVMAVIIAVYQFKEFVVEIIKNFYNWINEESGCVELSQINPEKAYYLIIIGGFVLFFLTRRILRDKHNRIRKKIFMHKKK
ncbi:MAG: hypothetical protein K2J68_05725, partial [Treponemataceae bacterium]|nr:hypothetical protein [Treponemataceae bacterium]